MKICFTSAASFLALLLAVGLNYHHPRSPSSSSPLSGHHFVTATYDYSPRLLDATEFSTLPQGDTELCAFIPPITVQLHDGTFAMTSCYKRISQDSAHHFVQRIQYDATDDSKRQRLSSIEPFAYPSGWEIDSLSNPGIAALPATSNFADPALVVVIVIQKTSNTDEHGLVIYRIALDMTIVSTTLHYLDSNSGYEIHGWKKVSVAATGNSGSFVVAATVEDRSTTVHKMLLASYDSSGSLSSSLITTPQGTDHVVSTSWPEVNMEYLKSGKLAVTYNADYRPGGVDVRAVICVQLFNLPLSSSSTPISELLLYPNDHTRILSNTGPTLTSGQLSSSASYFYVQFLTDFDNTTAGGADTNYLTRQKVDVTTGAAIGSFQPRNFQRAVDVSVRTSITELHDGSLVLGYDSKNFSRIHGGGVKDYQSIIARVEPETNNILDEYIIMDTRSNFVGNGMPEVISLDSNVLIVYTPDVSLALHLCSISSRLSHRPRPLRFSLPLMMPTAHQSRRLLLMEAMTVLQHQFQTTVVVAEMSTPPPPKVALQFLSRTALAKINKS